MLTSENRKIYLYFGDVSIPGKPPFYENNTFEILSIKVQGNYHLNLVSLFFKKLN